MPDVEWSEERRGGPPVDSPGCPGLAGHQLLRGVEAFAGARILAALVFGALSLALAPIGSSGTSPTASGP